MGRAETCDDLNIPMVIRQPASVKATFILDLPGLPTRWGHPVYWGSLTLQTWETGTSSPESLAGAPWSRVIVLESVSSPCGKSVWGPEQLLKRSHIITVKTCVIVNLGCQPDYIRNQLKAKLLGTPVREFSRSDSLKQKDPP